MSSIEKQTFIREDLLKLYNFLLLVYFISSRRNIFLFKHFNKILANDGNLFFRLYLFLRDSRLDILCCDMIDFNRNVSNNIINKLYLTHIITICNE